MEVLAKRLKWLREKHRYSQKEVAEMVGMSTGAIQKMEYGTRDPNLEVLSSLCDVYNVSADFLLGRTHNIGDIDTTSMRVHSLQARLEANQEYLLEVSLQINMMEYEINELSMKGNASDSIRAREMKLMELQSRKEVIEKQSYKLRENLNSEIIGYIEELVNIPESKPYEDSVIRRFQPFEFSVQTNIFEKYNIFLSGKGVGFSTYFGEYDVPEIAELEGEKLLKLLNG